ncbi:hypothetical protein KUL25_03575 [Rhodobacteraceae bacterium N5(2021)]|uniref:Uncharacterized protein n=1 Tax=Gymnodinialimonas phycosphaerae TaxID=2841589 RepID=A0A975YGR7_9RHOB|nr:hypothetical protein [Gymnodinialimonas phycosphaerae]MBY4891839.1 hypothetical protein [Gymnodinialimonas phycosphaerae]
MTDKAKTETLTDADLDDVQGGYEKIEWTVRKDSGEAHLKGADGKGLKQQRDGDGYLKITMEN